MVNRPVAQEQSSIMPTTNTNGRPDNVGGMWLFTENARLDRLAHFPFNGPVSVKDLSWNGRSTVRVKVEFPLSGTNEL